MTELSSIETSRLRLVAGDAVLIRLELGNRPALFVALHVEQPADWPPPLNDDDSFRFFMDRMENDPSLVGWGYWYVIEKQPNTLIGICGFKGRPDMTATAEVGYSIVEARQRLGFASEAIGALIEWCKKQGAKAVIAETYPELIASVRVMEKNGLTIDGDGSEPGVVRYRRALF
jgi:RimJ/RimL family protein N-acetyltransferase